jgi:hypothetical protein
LDHTTKEKGPAKVSVVNVVMKFAEERGVKVVEEVGEIP